MDVFEAIADPLRRDLLRALAQGPARVVDLASEHPVSRPAISRHLRLLGEAGLVSAEGRGRENHYRLLPGPLGHVTGYLSELGQLAGLDHLHRTELDSTGLDGTELDGTGLDRAETDRSGADRPETETGTGTGTQAGADPDPASRSAPATTAGPPVPQTALDALDTEVRRTVRDRRTGRAQPPAPSSREESA